MINVRPLYLAPFLIIVLFFSGCLEHMQQTTVNMNTDSTLSRQVKTEIVDTNMTEEKLEEKIIDTIFSLKEVKEREEYIERETKGVRHMTIWVAEKPTEKNKCYWIKAGEDNGTNLVTHYNFVVYPDSMRIMYYDVVNDQQITLDEWRIQDK